MFKLTLKTTKKEFKKLIFQAIKEEFDEYITKQIVGLEQSIRRNFFNFCIASDIVRELIEGDISGELGLPKYSAGPYIYDVCNKTTEFLTLDYIITENGGETTLYLREGWQAELLSSYPIPISETLGEPVRWLHWLLEEGSSIIIKNYWFYPQEPKGRSLQGIMVPTRSWSITDPVFAGTPEDNFLTRLVREFAKKLKPIFNQYFQDV